MLDNRQNGLWCFLRMLIVLLLFCAWSAAQAEPPQMRTFTLEGAVTFALQNYPAVRAALERSSAARAAVGLARTSYLPRADLLWQSNRATRNNIFGSLLPQSVIPSISGPVLSTSNNDSAWGSAGGLLLSWEPFDFGLRHATVKTAQSVQERANAEATLTRLDVATAAANAFLSLLANQEQVRAAQADVDRRQVFAKSVHVLADNQLRPGADASRADAELAGARIRLIQSEESEKESQALLAEVLGTAGSQVKAEPGPLLGKPPTGPLPASALSKHPLATADRAAIEEVQARERALDRSYYPRFNFQTAVFGRGSGANPDGTIAGGLNGLGLERSNWVVGLTITFPLFDFAALHARKQIEAANERAEAARYDQAVQELTGQLERARAAWESSQQVAENTPLQLGAARATEMQSRARYQAGLGTIVEVADAQRLLVEAEIEDSLAKLRVWQSFFQVAVAQGDLQPFLALVHAPTPGGP